MKMVKIGNDRINADELRDYFPDSKGQQYIIDLTYNNGVGSYIVFTTREERDNALNTLDTLLGVLGIHSELDEL